MTANVYRTESVADVKPLVPEIAGAIEYWLHLKMREMRGPGNTPHNENTDEYSYTLKDLLGVINEVAPAAITRMLAAGAQDYVREDDHA